MNTSRLEAFSDGVIAILITIMMLELHAPRGADWPALRAVFPSLLSYLLSFVFLGIYWNNHHHMVHLVERVTGGILWANLHLLFWLSLVPFVTGWVSEDHSEPLPTAIYGCVLLASAVAYTILQQTIIASQGAKSPLRAAIGNDVKGRLSGLTYIAAIPLAFVHPMISDALYTAVAITWLVPDRRIERVNMRAERGTS
ncbi:MAG: TMEM175 family protein [Gemmatimonadaceae bacterium]